jgi:hypothetical protein
VSPQWPGALLIGGGIAYGLGDTQSARTVRASGIRPMAIAAAGPLNEEALKAAPDLALDRRLREFQQALTKVWRTGLEDAAIGTEGEPADGTATTARTADKVIATTVAIAIADAAEASASMAATENADAAIAIGVAPTTPALSADPPIATPTATAAPSIAPPASATAAVEPAVATTMATVVGDASPDVRGRRRGAGRIR